MLIIKEVSRVLIGLVFVYSGFVKAIDPLGSEYKFLDYFHDAFGISWMDWSAHILAILMSAAEFLIGMCFLFSVKMKIASWAAAGFMLIFTPLTLYLAIANPVHDCGCFGDALILTNWQTFYKNIIIDIFILIAVLYRKSYTPWLKCRWEWVFVGGSLLLSLIISHCALQHLPMFDFRPYKVGTDLNHSLLVPEDAVQSEYESSCLYTNTKTGEQKEFALDSLPADPVWEWDSTINKLVVQGYEPPIHDFVITTAQGEDITAEIVADPNYNFLLVAYDLNKTDMDAFVKANDIARFCKMAGYNFRCLTASTATTIEEFKKELEGMVSEIPDSVKPDSSVQIKLIYQQEMETIAISETDPEPDSSWHFQKIDTVVVYEKPQKIAFDFYGMDPIQLKTMIRANPGMVLLRDGVIIGKWHYNDFPDVTDITENHFMARAFEDYMNYTSRMINRIILMLLIVTGLVYLSVYLYFRKNHRKNN